MHCSTKAIMRANMTSSFMPNAVICRLFASKDLATVVCCCLSPRQLGLSVRAALELYKYVMAFDYYHKNHCTQRHSDPLTVPRGTVTL